MRAEASPVQDTARAAVQERRSGTKRFWNSPFVFGAAVLAAVLFFQWPMFKGLFYKVVGGEAPSAVQWREDFQAARAEAGSNEKPILLVFSASWCPACLMMKHDVWSDAAVGKLANKRFVPVYVDVDDPQHAALTSRYGIGAIPAVLIVDKDGKVLREASAMSRSTTLKFLSKDAAKDHVG